MIWNYGRDQDRESVGGKPARERRLRLAEGRLQREVRYILSHRSYDRSQRLEESSLRSGCEHRNLECRRKEMAGGAAGSCHWNAMKRSWKDGVYRPFQTRTYGQQRQILRRHR